MKEQKTIYYSDELNDEFSEAKIEPRIIDENYVYIQKNALWNFASYLVQNFFSMPIKILYSKIKFKHKFIGKEKLKSFKKQGYFIYVNHTQAFADTFIPSLANYPKRNFLIVNPENVSMKGLHTIVEMLGAIPIPNDLSAMKNFLEAIKYRIKKGYSITIYPEAHIWPYYTKIRNFKDVSFKYPIELNVPAFCITNTYKAYGKNKNKIKIISFIDGPFYPEKEVNGEELNKKQKQKNLRDKIYNKMCERSKKSNIVYIKYIKRSEEIFNESRNM